MKKKGDSEGCENSEDSDNYLWVSEFVKGYRHGTLRFIYLHLGGYGGLAAI